MTTTTNRTCNTCNGSFPLDGTYFAPQAGGTFRVRCRTCATRIRNERQSGIASGTIVARVRAAARHSPVSVADLTFGVELEYGNIGREIAARAIQSVVGGTVEEYYARALGHTAQGWSVTQADGRKWICESDGSISGLGDSAEVVSPILKLADMDQLQAVVRALRTAGALVNETTGMHVHVGCANWQTARATVAHFAAVQDAVYASASVPERRFQWARPLDAYKVERLVACSTDAQLRAAVAGRTMTVSAMRQDKYVPARYVGLNLLPFWRQGTVEVRLFNSTTHAGKVRAAVMFALSLVAAAMNGVAPVSATADRAGMVRALDNLGLSDETVRGHFVAKWDGERTSASAVA